MLASMGKGKAAMKAPKSKVAAVKTKAKPKARAAKGKAVENLPKTAEEDESGVTDVQ